MKVTQMSAFHLKTIQQRANRLRIILLNVMALLFIRMEWQINVDNVARPYLQLAFNYCSLFIILGKTTDQSATTATEKTVFCRFFSSKVVLTMAYQTILILGFSLQMQMFNQKKIFFGGNSKK
jgi:hypothetical protein